MSQQHHASADLSAENAAAKHWLGFYQKLRQQKRANKLGNQAAQELLANYRKLEHELARAPDGHYKNSLQSLYLQTQEILLQPTGDWRQSLLHWLKHDLPNSFAKLRMAIAICVSLFLLFAIAGFLMVHFAEDTAAMFMSQAQMDEVRAGKVWTDSVFGVAPAVVLSFNIFLNNFIVALTTFAVGVIFGLGTIYMLGTNGLMLGALLAFCHHYGVMYRLLHFIPAHGIVELFIICVAAGCGLQIGNALVHPSAQNKLNLRHQGATAALEPEEMNYIPTRIEAFRDAIKLTTPVMIWCALGLIVCGVIEGYVSPNPAIPLWLRLLIGVGWFVIFYAVLSGAWIRKTKSEFY